VTSARKTIESARASAVAHRLHRFEAMPRYLLIISRETPYLVDYMREQFRDEPSVEIFLDRRKADRRGTSTPPGQAGSTDRRRRLDVDRALRESFHVFITLD
jgi:hypothetical protein